MTDICRATADVEQWLALKVTTGKCSTILHDQLAAHYVNRTYNVFQIWDEIGAMEGAAYCRPSMTKVAAPFRKPPLLGFWHKHFFQARFLLQNLQNEWHPQNVPFIAAVDEFCRDRHVGKFTHDLVIGLYQNRSASRTVTGEWIVYAPIGGKNFYLTLGKHGDDQTVFENIRRCVREFPELQSILDKSQS